MTFPLRRIAASLTGLAVGILFFAATFAPSGADAQSTAIKRAAPPAKAHGKSAARTPSSWVPNPAVNGKDAYLILDATSGRELVADRADELRHPASLTKLMTIYLAFSALDSGRLSLGDALPVSINALNAPPTKIGLPPNGTVIVRDAIMALVTRSANDAAIVIAEALGGDEASFALLMTRKARQLGMSSTVYRNASGLPNREQVTTARDLARLAFALMRDFPHYYAIFSVQSYPYHGRILENHNRMLLSYEGADGLKTGYTVASGFNLVMSAMRDNRRLIGVVMGGDSASQRDRMMADLMDYGFTTAQSMRPSPWTSIRKPASARYTAVNFDPSLVIPETTPRLAAAPPPAPAAAPAPAQTFATEQRVAGPAVPPPAPPAAAPGGPSIGSWVIQVGSFNDSQAAQLALERASSALPDSMRSAAAATVDEVQMANKSFHRARLANLSQAQAVDGCKQLEKRKIYCSAIQVTAWNTPGAR
jgi:D-alanyl-D-alanine carboxypeptidase